MQWTAYMVSDSRIYDPRIGRINHLQVSMYNIKGVPFWFSTRYFRQIILVCLYQQHLGHWPDNCKHCVILCCSYFCSIFLLSSYLDFPLPEPSPWGMTALMLSWGDSVSTTFLLSIKLPLCFCNTRFGFLEDIHFS